MSTHRSAKMIAAAALAASLAALPAMSYGQPSGGGNQPPGSGGQPPGAQGSGQKVDPATVEKFATANQEISTIRRDFSEQLQSVEDRDKAQRLQQQAQEQMVEAVEEAGLSVSKYNELANRMNSDPAFREKVMNQ